ncbi:winged helix-turn-helix transcriptional regulator [Xanthocytophaga flava]|uniref:winged helix-turn-helix transcriptional regulator n=1 Tax=Xanthocytophaga flava TaxID=3048013 RepID=UPI0028D022FE|nr:helix-turn-helix domain-containing protein [Xanthocytophaga flavus]MDJ1470806.1 helix-turn-helix domain-containing protein [Xanthocytophaga flavus]
MRKKIFIDEKPLQCPSQLRAIHDTMDLLDGKWKITIIGCLSFGNKRFMDLQREVEGIGSKMLSKELQELEINGLVSRTVMNTRPVTVEYALTSYGQTLRPILWEMAKWGQTHRKKIFSDNEDLES